MTFPSKEILEQLRMRYPRGTRIELIHMDDPYNKTLVPESKGTVRFVDAAGTLQMDWDCGSSLGLIPGTDSFRIIDKENKTHD